MSRKITKTMAADAAKKMGDAAYAAKRVAVENQINVMGGEFVRKYIPSPVLACVAEYGDYFNTTRHVNITTTIETSYGVSRERYIHGSVPFRIPSTSSDLSVSREDYDAINALQTKLTEIKKQQEAFENQVFEALVALKTERSVEKELPEAMKYIDFPEVKDVPMPVFDELRGILSKL